MHPYIFTTNGITVYRRGVPVSIASDDEAYSKIYDALKANDDVALEQALESKAKKIERAAQQLSVDVRVEGNVVYYKDFVVDNSLTRRLLQALAEGFTIDPLVRFLENLMRNPSFRAVQDLYTFLEVGKMPITSDGHFLAYKAVRENFTDIHSGKFDNSIGKVVEMPRNQVDENPNQTCSAGLHACSYEYLPSFAHASGHVVIVKINPADVVAIPADYNSTKMRVCRYEVVGEVDGWYNDRRNTLGNGGIVDDYDDTDDAWNDDEVDDVECGVDSDASWLAADKYTYKVYLVDTYGDEEVAEFGTAGEAVDHARERSTRWKMYEYAVYEVINGTRGRHIFTYAQGLAA